MCEQWHTLGRADATPYQLEVGVEPDTSMIFYFQVAGVEVVGKHV